MTSIESLPPELLYKILSTGCIERDIFRSPLPTLCRTALVARCWTEPSQDLLIRSAECRQLVPILSSEEERPSVQGRSVRLLEFRTEDAEMLLEGLGRRGIRVEGMDVLHGHSMNLGSLQEMLMDNLKYLQLWCPSHGRLSLPPSANLPLQHLTLLAPFAPPLDFLSPLISSSPHLTRLELLWFDQSKQDFPARMEAPLMALAPQLRHLSLQAPPLPFPPSRGPETEPFSIASFLNACTSLHSLQIAYILPASLPTSLSLLPTSAPLLVLSTFLPDLTGPHNSAKVPLILKVLESPVLKGLRRWRVNSQWWSDLGRLKEWTEGCEKLGVEPRGSERYYTD